MSSEKIPSRYQTILTPIFDREMGKRMANARMKLGMSQSELASKLGVSQSVISFLESGKTQTGKFTLGQLLAALGDGANYVLRGVNKDHYEMPRIRLNFWNKRLKTDRGKPKLNQKEAIDENDDGEPTK